MRVNDVDDPSTKVIYTTAAGTSSTLVVNSVYLVCVSVCDLDIGNTARWLHCTVTFRFSAIFVCLMFSFSYIANSLCFLPELVEANAFSYRYL